MGRVLNDNFEFVFCPHCAAKNPKKAYVCLVCFKVMFPRVEQKWWKVKIPPSISFAVILSALVYSILFLGIRWLNTVEANMTLNVKTSNYNLNVIADKKKNESLNKEIDLKSLNSGNTPPSDFNQ